MLRTKSLLAFVLVLGSVSAQAASGGANMSKGGLGYLFPDHNSFANSAKFGSSRGIGVQAEAVTTNTTRSTSVTPSIVYGNGRFGLGAYYDRTGTNLSTAPQTVGLGMGANLIKGRLGLGVTYDATTTAFGSGNLGVNMALIPAGGKGISLGAGITKPLTGSTMTLNAAVGFAFNPMTSFEIDALEPNTSSFTSYTLSAYLNMMKQVIYFSGGYAYARNGASFSHGVSGRLGFSIGKAVDLSAVATYFFTTPSVATYGATFRVGF